MIKIINNFFDDKLFSDVQNHVTTKLHYFPVFLKGKEKNKENYYGNRFFLANDKSLFDTFVKQAEEKFKIKIKKIGEDSAIDQRNLNHFKPHQDEGAKINVLVMLKGPTAVTNGTVFYSENELDIHIGFRENRAVLFPSNWVHSQHASNVPNLRRFTASLFIEDYEE
tara:strand:- start:21 stop:521 length:501 start_codon:yes stop_codon:yes gene_type:complete